LLAWGKVGLPFGACLRLRIIDDFWTLEGLSLIRKGVDQVFDVLALLDVLLINDVIVLLITFVQFWHF